MKVDDSQILSYGYDDLSRLSTRTLNTTNPFVTRYGYLDGAMPNSTTALIKSVQNGNDTLAYTYDELGNITEIYENGELSRRYTYDALGQLTRDEDWAGLFAYGYTYDNGGNILKVTVYDLTVSGDYVDHEVVYGYGDANWKDKLTSFNGQAITYDEIGNPLTYRDGMAFTWQHGRELASFSKAGTTATYSYNDSGIRTKKVVNGVETEYYLNGSTILTQITGDERLDFLYDDSECLFGLRWNGQNYYYFRNLQGDIIGILDSDGNQVVEYVYDAWGQEVGRGGTMWQTLGERTPFRYRGYYYDTESGLYYLNSRYYDPEISRFLNADAILIGMAFRGLNLFICNNNPVNCDDSTGNYPGYHYQTRYNAERAAALYKIKNPEYQYHTIDIQYVSGLPESHPFSATWIYQLISPAPVFQSVKDDLIGPPNSSKQYYDKNGNLKIETWFGPDGRATTSEHHTNHGNSKKHPKVPHRHDWDWSDPEHPKEGDWYDSLLPAAGVGIMVITGLGIIWVIGNDATGIGVADDPLLGPLGSAFAAGAGMVIA